MQELFHKDSVFFLCRGMNSPDHERRKTQDMSASQTRLANLVLTVLSIRITVSKFGNVDIEMDSKIVQWPQ